MLKLGDVLKKPRVNTVKLEKALIENINILLKIGDIIQHKRKRKYVVVGVFPGKVLAVRIYSDEYTSPYLRKVRRFENEQLKELVLLTF
jgi:hypothetical protein